MLHMKQFRYIFIIFCLLSLIEGLNATDLSFVSKIDLAGNWKFALEFGNEGMAAGWYAEQYNDSTWMTLQAGKSWNEQGITHAGFGWYRKNVFIPAEYKNQSAVLCLGEILYDDDVFFNGQKIGGLHGGYKYKNIIKREYAIPDSLIKYGEENTLVVRTWGMLEQGVEGDRFGLANGPFYISFDPFAIKLQRADVGQKGECDPRCFDISDGQHGLSFNIIYRLKESERCKTLETVHFSLFDYYENELKKGRVICSDSIVDFAKITIPVDEWVARKIYFAGRFKLLLVGKDSNGRTLFETIQNVDRLSYESRDNMMLNDIFKDVVHDTPYGKLRLVDEIDCSLDVKLDEHPYMQSGFDKRQQFQTPGSPVEVFINDILGRKVRESEPGWFAYRVGRGKLSAGKMYLLRIEYPEDKPRYCPIEIQNGENYMDIGWRTGVSTDNPYDNWSLSGKYEWFDVIVPLDKNTTGASGANGASSENGIWVYFMNKRDYPGYFPFFQGGPAISRIKLYEMDTDESELVINKPEGLPERILMCDWERQPLVNPEGVVQYCKFMGYNAISPVIMKWHDMNYAEPLAGYNSYNVDSLENWNRLDFDQEKGAKQAIPGRNSVHYNFLEATKKYGLYYIPRIEYGGSLNLPIAARAVSADGNPAKPSRFAQWCADLLQPAVYDDFKDLLDFLIGKNIEEYPQIKGVLWRIRCDRMPISYSKYDIELFSSETGIELPKGLSDKDLAKWVSTEKVQEYVDWWHQKRADFHERLAQLIRTYRRDLKMYYYNWDNDKFALGLTDFTGWDFLAPVAHIAKTNPDSALNLYLKNVETRKKFSGADYVSMIKFGDLGVRLNKLPHHGLRPYLYKNIKGFELFAPANSLYLADNKEYLDYFETVDGVAVSNAVPYDESFSRFINPKYEGHETVPGGPQFGMALELMSYFHSDAQTLSFTTYTYGRGFAETHRRFAQAYLALPAIKGDVLPYDDADVRIRKYETENGIYIGVASKSHLSKTIKVELPITIGKRAKIKNLVTGQLVRLHKSGDKLWFDVESRPMELNSFLVN